MRERKGENDADQDADSDNERQGIRRIRVLIGQQQIRLHIVEKRQISKERRHKVEEKARTQRGGRHFRHFRRLATSFNF